MQKPIVSILEYLFKKGILRQNMQYFCIAITNQSSK